MWGRALDAVYPRTCAGCGEGAWPFCADCVRDLRPLAPPWCRRCGSPSILPVPSCRDCPPPPLDSARAAFVYDGPARRAIHRLKFSGWRDVAAAMADAMAAVGPPAAADVVTWVPLARGRRAERGYDQARALAVALAHRLDLPAARLLRRSVATDPQARRSGAERRTAMRGVFRAVRAVPRPGPAGRRRAHDRRHPRRGGRGSCVPVAPAKSTRWLPRVRCRAVPRCGPPAGRPILGWAHVRVCGCPGMFPGSRCQPRAKRPT